MRILKFSGHLKKAIYHNCPLLIHSTFLISAAVPIVASWHLVLLAWLCTKLSVNITLHGTIRNKFPLSFANGVGWGISQCLCPSLPFLRFPQVSVNPIWMAHLKIHMDGRFFTKPLTRLTQNLLVAFITWRVCLIILLVTLHWILKNPTFPCNPWRNTCIYKEVEVVPLSPVYTLRILFEHPPSIY